MSGSVRGGHFDFPILQGVIGGSTLFIALFSALLRGANWPVTWTLICMAITVFFVMQIIVDALTGLSRPAKRVWPAGVLFGAVLVWGILQTLPGFLSEYAHPVWRLVPDADPRISADPQSGIHVVLRLASYAMVFWIILRSTESSRGATRFLLAIAVFTAAMSAYGIWSAFTGENPILGEETGGRVQASFANQNSFATYAIFAALTNLGAYLLLTEGAAQSAERASVGFRRFLERFFGGAWIFALGFLASIAALVQTQSRAGSAAGLIAILAFFVIYALRKRGKALLYFLVPVAFVVFAMIALAAGVVQRFALLKEDNLRFIIFPRVIEGINDRFWVGHGLNAFEETFRAYVPLEAALAEWNEAHSTILENFYELGVPAASVFYAALLYVSVAILIGNFVRQRNRVFSCVGFAAILGAAVHSAVDFSLEIPAVTLLFAAVLGLSWSQAFRTDYVEPR